MRAYDAQHSNRQLKNSPISFGGHFAKFDARQSFPLYGMTYYNKRVWQQMQIQSTVWALT